MKKQRHELKILLLQIREDEETMLEEFYEFVQFSGLHESQFTTLNTFKTLDFPADIVDDYDALFIGGSSDASVLKVEEFIFVPHCKNLVRYCFDHNIPVLASCFGFQIAIEELGGKVINDPEHMEMGIYAIELTDEAKQDPLLHDYPERFWAVSGHKERASRIPSDCVLLGSTKDCPYHIVKFANKPFYCFQFHPEVDRNDLVTRITRYQMRYLSENQSLQHILDASTQETPYSNKLVKDFVDRVIMTSL